MAGLDLKKFAGKMPIAGHRTLPDHFATESVNTWLYSGELRGIRPVTDLDEPGNPGTKKVFRIPMRTPGGDAAWQFHDIVPPVVPPAAYLGDSIWWDMDDPDTDIVRSVLANDSHDRFYFCSPTHGIEYNTYERMQNGQSNHRLGVPVPTDKIDSITVEAGVGNMVSRAYVFTYQTEYGEESAPCEPTQKAGQAFKDANSTQPTTWQLHGIVTPSDPPGQPRYKYVNIYRSVTGEDGVATYFMVSQVNVLDAATVDNPFNDALPDTTITNNLQLPSVGWLPPPVDTPADPTATPPKEAVVGLQGIVKMPNGFLIGWAGSDIYMSVPYQPHAWPIEYIISTEYPIVGMGVVGQTCFVMTEGYPEAVTGTDPISTQLIKVNVVEPCLSRGSIVTTLGGVWYASPNGLMVIGPGGLQNATKQIITREQWLRDYAPEYIRAVRYQEGYLALRCYPDPTIRTGFYLDPTSLDVALTELSGFERVENLVSDIWSGEVFRLQDRPAATPQPYVEIQRWDAPGTDLMPLVWRSKEFQAETEMNFGVYAVYWDEERFAANDWNTELIPRDTRVRVLAWQNRRLVYERDVPTSKNGKAMRLPSGSMGDLWQFEIRARAPIYSFATAQTEKELQGA